MAAGVAARVATEASAAAAAVVRATAAVGTCHRKCKSSLRLVRRCHPYCRSRNLVRLRAIGLGRARAKAIGL
eukprot:scaffold94310_cov39-Phaeocystis_antarctica.AAC.2